MEARTFVVSAVFALAACAPSTRLGARSRALSPAHGPAVVLTDVESTPPTPNPPRAVVLVVRRAGDGPVADHLRAAAGFAMMGMRVAFAEPSDPGTAVAAVRRALDEVLGAGRPAARPVVIVGTHADEVVAARVASEDPRVTHLLLLGGAHASALDEVRASTLAVVGTGPCPEGPDVRCARHEGLAAGLSDQPLLPRVEVDVVRWIGATGLLGPAEVAAYEARVRRQHPDAFPSER